MQIVNVLINLLEKFVPATDQLTLSLVLDKFKLILSPTFLNVPQELFEDKFTTSLCKHLIDNLLVLEKVSVNQMRDCQFIETDLFQGKSC